MEATPEILFICTIFIEIFLHINKKMQSHI
jgi:hypothetical protein